MTARPGYIELPAKDLAASTAFYEQAFGLDFKGFGPSYAATMTDDVDIGLQADAAEMTAAPLPVISVPDLQTTLAAVQAAGGIIKKPIFGYPGGRRFHFTDPHGNEMAAMQPD